MGSLLVTMQQIYPIFMLVSFDNHLLADIKIK